MWKQHASAHSFPHDWNALWKCSQWLAPTVAQAARKCFVLVTRKAPPSRPFGTKFTVAIWDHQCFLKLFLKGCHPMFTASMETDKHIFTKQWSRKILVEISTGLLYWVHIVRFLWQRGYRGRFCEKMLEASSMFSRANARQLLDGCATSGGKASVITHLRR